VEPPSLLSRVETCHLAYSKTAFSSIDTGSLQLLQQQHLRGPTTQPPVSTGADVLVPLAESARHNGQVNSCPTGKLGAREALILPTVAVSKVQAAAVSLQTAPRTCNQKETQTCHDSNMPCHCPSNIPTSAGGLQPQQCLCCWAVHAVCAGDDAMYHSAVCHPSARCDLNSSCFSSSCCLAS